MIHLEGAYLLVLLLLLLFTERWTGYSWGGGGRAYKC